MFSFFLFPFVREVSSDTSGTNGYPRQCGDDIPTLCNGVERPLGNRRIHRERVRQDRGVGRYDRVNLCQLLRSRGVGIHDRLECP